MVPDTKSNILKSTLYSDILTARKISDIDIDNLKVWKTENDTYVVTLAILDYERNHERISLKDTTILKDIREGTYLNGGFTYIKDSIIGNVFKPTKKKKIFDIVDIEVISTLIKTPQPFYQKSTTQVGFIVAEIKLADSESDPKIKPKAISIIADLKRQLESKNTPVLFSIVGIARHNSIINFASYTITKILHWGWNRYPKNKSKDIFNKNGIIIDQRNVRAWYAIIMFITMATIVLDLIYVRIHN